MRRRRAAGPEVDRSAFAGFRFQPEVITVAVRWYLRFGPSYRDLEELLAERGVEVDHVTVYRMPRPASSAPAARRTRSHGLLGVTQPKIAHAPLLKTASRAPLGSRHER